MPSRAARVVAGVLVALVFTYSLVIAQRVLHGVIAASLIVLTTWLVSYGRESGAVRSLASPHWAAALAVASAILAYSLVIAQQLLFGVVTASLVLLVAAALSYLRDRGYAPSMSRARTLAVATLSTLVLAYALLIAQQILLGLLTVALIALVAWLTSPTGPIAGR